jgi:hypothetical protein
MIISISAVLIGFGASLYGSHHGWSFLKQIFVSGGFGALVGAIHGLTDNYKKGK